MNASEFRPSPANTPLSERYLITHLHLTTINIYILGGARGVVVIVVGIGHGDTSSNPGRDWLHFT